MSLLRKYCNDFYNISYSEFDNMPLEEREMLSKTYGYCSNLDWLKLQIAWDNFKDSLELTWWMKIWFKIKGL